MPRCAAQQRPSIRRWPRCAAWRLLRLRGRGPQRPRLPRWWRAPCCSGCDRGRGPLAPGQ
eukprot:3197758-Lingulodinium_polyedra.AAC.1